MADLSSLATEVQAVQDQEDAAEALIAGIAAQLKAVATDPAKITALANQLAASRTKLAAAVVANTPASPPGPVATAPVVIPPA